MGIEETPIQRKEQKTEAQLETEEKEFAEKYKDMIGKEVIVEFTTRHIPTNPLNAKQYSLLEQFTAIFTAKKREEAVLVGISDGTALFEIEGSPIKSDIRLIEKISLVN